MLLGGAGDLDVDGGLKRFEVFLNAESDSQTAVLNGPADGEDLHQFGGGVVAACVHADQSGLLPGGEPGLLAAQLALGLGDGHALARPGLQQVHLKLSGEILEDG